MRTDIQTAILAIFSLQNGYEPESNGKALRMQLLERGMLAFKQASAGCTCSPYAQHYTITCLDSSSYMWPFSSTSEIHTVGLLDFMAREVSNHRAPLDHDGFAAGRTFSGHRFFIACSFCLAFPSTIVWQLPRQQA